MTERPIIFSGPMVRAILAGRKTVTRRVVKLPKWADSSQGIEVEQLHGDGPPWPVAISRETGCPVDLDCPYGQPGDRLWVRETWTHDAPDIETARAAYEDALLGGMTYGPYYRATECAPDTLTWRPSIHMPRWASRITLEVMSVRVERLQEISEADAHAEGATWADNRPGHDYPKTKREAFSALWDSINGKSHPWSSNPWVWRVEFKRVEAE